MISKIVSGGQTGADRAALDVAIKYGFSYGGWCPKGRKAEDGHIPSDYLLEEAPSGGCPQRTKMNARDSDATVIFTMTPKISGGSRLTFKSAEALSKPWLHLNPEMDDNPVEALCEFVERHRVGVLNVAGSRGSKEPELYGWVCKVLESAFFAEQKRALDAALGHLGPEIAAAGIVDNADCAPAYGDRQIPNCWRVYFQIAGSPQQSVGGDSPYVLMEKQTHRILGRGTEPGE